MKMLRIATLAACAALLGAALAGCGDHGAISAVHAQNTGTAGTVTVSWGAPTQNTDGSSITGTLTYAVYEMQPCSTSVACASDTASMSIVATGVSTLSVQVSNVPNGYHCYSVQTLEVLPDGANTASLLAPIDPSNMCIMMTGSATPESSPNVPINVKAIVG